MTSKASDIIKTKTVIWGYSGKGGYSKSNQRDQKYTVAAKAEHTQTMREKTK